MTRETDSIFSTLGSRRGGHGARTRLAAGGSPVDYPSGEPSGAEIGRARPARKRPDGRQKHGFTLLYIEYTAREGFMQKHSQDTHATSLN